MSANSTTISKAYENFAHGNIPAVFAAFDAAIRWHIPGHSPLSGDFTGHDQVAEFSAALWNFQEVRSATMCTTSRPTATSSSHW